MYAINYETRNLVDVDLEGAKGVMMRWLIGRRTGAKTYAMRYFEISPGGIIPLHTHPEEHEIFVLQGRAVLLGSEKEEFAEKDDVVFIESEIPHGYDNTAGTEPFRFICVIPLLEKNDE